MAYFYTEASHDAQRRLRRSNFLSRYEWKHGIHCRPCNVCLHRVAAVLNDQRLIDNTNTNIQIYSLWRGVCMLAYRFEYDCWNPTVTWREAGCRVIHMLVGAVSRVTSHAAVGAAAASCLSNCSALLTESQSLIVVCVWDARPWCTPQVTMRSGHNVTTDGPPWARSTELAGRIWPAGRTLPTPVLEYSLELCA